MHTIERIFYPVGHGGFYAEHHKKPNFKIIYDCGSVSQKAINRTIDNHYSDSDVIDLLIISHFHKDHISGIEHLAKTVSKIKLVLIPYLTDEQILFSSIIETKSLYTYDYYKNIDKKFHPETIVIYVRPENGSEDSITLEYNELLKPSNSEIASGTKIRLLNTYWGLIIRNLDYTFYSPLFVKELELLGIDKNQIMANYSYFDQHKNAILNIFRNILTPRNFNNSSLLVYTGLLEPFQNHPILVPIPPHSDGHRIDNPGCILTGDINLNNADLSVLFPSVAKNVGIVQIPHHGSIHNYNDLFFSQNHNIQCPIFVPNKSMKHPALSVIDSLKQNQCNPIKITYENKTIFKHRIYSHSLYW